MSFVVLKKAAMSLKEFLPYYKRNIYIAIPVMLSQAGQITVHLIDNIMVGHVGTTELAAASFAGSIFIVGFVFGMGFTFGLTPLIGQAFGNNRTEKVGEILNNSFYLNLFLSFSLFLVLFALSYFMKYMGQPPDVIELAVPYYRLLVYSLIPFLLFFTFKQFLEGVGNTRISMYVTLFANVINVILNYILIYGKLGFSEYGLNGAGYATLISRILMPIIIIYWLFNHKEFKSYFKYISHNFLKLYELKRLIKISFPIALQLIVEVMAFAFGGIMMGWIGEIPLAAHQIALGLASFTFMVATGVGSATTIRVSHQLGAQKYFEMRRAAYASIHLVVAFMGIGGVLFFTLRDYLPMIFTTDPEVIAVASKLLIFAAIFQIVDGLQMVSISCLRAISDVNYPLLISFVSYGIVFFGISYLLTFVLDLGPEGIWAGFVISLAIASISFLRRFNKLSNNYLSAIAK
jgi:MATE family multidrug resistance protein